MTIQYVHTIRRLVKKYVLCQTQGKPLCEYLMHVELFEILSRVLDAHNTCICRGVGDGSRLTRARMTAPVCNCQNPDLLSERNDFS